MEEESISSVDTEGVRACLCAVKKMRGRESTQVERRRSHLKAMKDLTARDGGNDIVCNKLNYTRHLTGFSL